MTSGTGYALDARANWASAAIHAAITSSSGGNAVFATNVKTDWTAAVISAGAGNDNGLAYWGTGGIQVTGSAVKPGGGSWSATSDARVKKDILDFTTGMAALKQVHPVTYRYNGLGKTTDDGKRYTGVIAQELEQLLPSMVNIRMQKLKPGDAEDTDVREVDPSAFTYILINAVKEQQATIDRQEARIAALEKANAHPLSFGGTGTAGAGVGIAGFALAGALLVSRKNKREQRF
jgi:hypothetical protein